jgi:hypothetical protein
MGSGGGAGIALRRFYFCGETSETKRPSETVRHFRYAKVNRCVLRDFGQVTPDLL